MGIQGKTSMNTDVDYQYCVFPMHDDFFTQKVRELTGGVRKIN